MTTIQQMKPKKTSADLVAKLKTEKGVLFNITSEADAIDYLLNENNYLRTASYRKNYRTTPQGKYLRLEFAYLQELTEIDTKLRNILTKMCIDVEHDLKVSLLADLENNTNEDGYSIVVDFLNVPQNNYIANNITRNMSSPFVGNLIDKYFVISQAQNPNTGKIENVITQNNCPVWVLVEILSFGDFIKLYEFYYQRKNIKPPIQKSVLKTVKSLRNGCAHNNCLICDLSPEKNVYSPTILCNYISKFKGIKHSNLNKKLRCRFIMEFSGLIYVYAHLNSTSIKTVHLTELKELFFKRIPGHKTYFRTNDKLMGTFFFLAKILRSI